jgi:aminobenzoyl-glutamate utilization protein B
MRFVALLLLLIPSIAAAQSTDSEALKREALAVVETHRDELIDLADQVWRFAETALRETKSSALLADYAEKRGFTVTRGLAGMPTAFVAEFGSGKPVIGIMGEYDALPGISQKAQPTKEPLVAGGAGHGCGHNLFGPGSLGAALAIKELIDAGEISGTVRFYGTPAEEAVGGKIYMARDGLFDDVDVMLAWHPDTASRADMVGGQALVDLAITFEGRTAHAAYDPWNGRSAADGVEAFTHGINLLREHVKPSVRMHYVVQNAGDVPNVVPEHARVWLWVRDFTRDGVEDVLVRVREIAEGAALVAGVKSTVTIQSGDYEILINTAGARALDENLRWVGPPEFTAEEERFARQLQESAGVEVTGMDTEIEELDGQVNEGGSTDVGDVSWVVPTLHVSVVTAPEAPWHAWPVVAASGMSIGHKGMIYAAKTLAATVVDLFADDDLRKAVREEFQESTKGFTYEPYVPDGPPPVPSQSNQ